MDSSYRCRDGEFATAEEAFARCRQIVDEYLDDAEKIEGRESATKLWESYKMFVEDPCIVAKDVTPASFSAWASASRRCEELTGDSIAEGRYLTQYCSFTRNLLRGSPVTTAFCLGSLVLAGLAGR
jgi:hypothetical protein